MCLFFPNAQDALKLALRKQWQNFPGILKAAVKQQYSMYSLGQCPFPDSRLKTFLRGGVLRAVKGKTCELNVGL